MKTLHEGLGVKSASTAAHAYANDQRWIPYSTGLSEEELLSRDVDLATIEEAVGLMRSAGGSSPRGMRGASSWRWQRLT